MGFYLEGTRKSRAPSGVERVRRGVSTSRKFSSSSKNRRMTFTTLCRSFRLATIWGRLRECRGTWGLSEASVQCQYPTDAIHLQFTCNKARRGANRMTHTPRVAHGYLFCDDWCLEAEMTGTGTRFYQKRASPVQIVDIFTLSRSLVVHA